MTIIHVQRISLWLAVLFACAYAQGPMSSSSGDAFGEYCFAKEMSKDRNVWKLEKYKGNKEYLFSYIPCSFKGHYWFNNTNGAPLFGHMLNTSVYNDKKPSKCLKERFDSREYISLDVIWEESAEAEQSKFIEIKDTYYDINWNVTYDSSYVRLNTSGSAKIYISGFCTEEQLKQASELKEKFAQEHKIRERIEKEIRKEMIDKEE